MDKHTLEQIRNLMEEGRKVDEILLYEVREMKKDIQKLNEVVTILKTEKKVMSGFFGIVGGVIVQLVHLFYKAKGG